MSVYEQNLAELDQVLTSNTDAINASVARLNQYVDMLNYHYEQSKRGGSTAREAVRDWNNVKALYDAEYVNYERLIAAYEDLEDRYDKASNELKRYITYRKTHVLSDVVPSMKDRTEILAGGAFGITSTGAGGVFWSPTKTPSMDLTGTYIDKNSQLLAGEILPFLGYGFGNIQSIVNGGTHLDLMTPHRVKEVIVYRVDIDVTVGTFYQVKELYIRVSSTPGSTVQGVEVSKDGINYEASFMQAMESFGYQMNGVEAALSMAVSRSPLGEALPFGIVPIMTVSVYNLVNGDVSRAKDVLGHGIISSIVSGFSQLATQHVVAAIGITDALKANIVGAVIGGVFGELAEMAMGYDNSFGYGGEFDRQATGYFGLTKSQLNVVDGATYGASEGFLGVSTFMDKVSYKLGLTDSFTQAITDRYNNIVGYSYTTEGYTRSGEMGDVTGYGETVNEAMFNYSIQTSINLADNLGLSYDQEMTTYAMAVSAVDVATASAAKAMHDYNTPDRWGNIGVEKAKAEYLGLSHNLNGWMASVGPQRERLADAWNKAYGYEGWNPHERKSDFGNAGRNDPSNVGTNDPNKADNSDRATERDFNAPTDKNFGTPSSGSSSGGRGSCFSKWQKVCTANRGTVFIYELVEGDIVLTTKGYSKVLYIMKYEGWFDIYKFKGILATGNHVIGASVMAALGALYSKERTVYNIYLEGLEDIQVGDSYASTAVPVSYELYRRGLITKEEYELDKEITSRLESDYDVAIGYNMVGKLMFRYMGTGKLLSKLLKYSLKNRNNSIFSRVCVKATKIIGIVRKTVIKLTQSKDVV